MSKKDKKLEVVGAPVETAEIAELKSTAEQLAQFYNASYRESVAYVADSSKVATVTVNNWLKLSEVFQEGSELPGLPIGNITCVYGKPDCGKTTFLMEAIAQCQKQGILPILILTEHKFDFKRLSTYMGADPSAMLVFQPNTIEEGYSYVEKIIRDLESGKIVIDVDGKDISIDVSNQSAFIFWDSIGNTLSDNELEADIVDWEKNMGKTAKAIKTLTRRLNNLLSREKVRQRCGVLFLNQSYMSMPSYGPSVETPFGGVGVPYSSALVLRFRSAGKLKATTKGKEMIIGLETKISVEKNHITQKQATFSVYTVAKVMIEATKESLEEFKKTYLR